MAPFSLDQDNNDDDSDASADSVIHDVANKQDLDLARQQTTNTSHLVYKFYQDPLLQNKINMIVEGGQFIHHAYAENLARMKEGQEAMVIFAAERAGGIWWRKTVAGVLNSVNNPTTMANIGLLPKNNSIYWSCDSEEPWVKEQIEIAQQYENFVTCIASNETWTQLMFTICFPFIVAVVHEPDVHQRLLGCAAMKLIIEGYEKAAAMVKSDPIAHHELKTCLEDAAYTQQNFALKTMARCKAAGCDPNNDELKTLATLMCAGSSTTADVMEKSFNNLAQVASKQSKGKKMSEYNKWFHASSSPYIATGGLPQCVTSAADYLHAKEHLKNLSKKNSVCNRNKTALNTTAGGYERTHFDPNRTV